MDSDDILQRALRAYRSDICAANAEHLHGSCPALKVLGGLSYVVIKDEHRRVLAVYRVRRCGLLRRLRRWPPALNREAAPQPVANKQIKGEIHA